MSGDHAVEEEFTVRMSAVGVPQSPGKLTSSHCDTCSVIVLLAVTIHAYNEPI